MLLSKLTNEIKTKQHLLDSNGYWSNYVLSPVDLVRFVTSNTVTGQLVGPPRTRQYDGDARQLRPTKTICYQPNKNVGKLIIVDSGRFAFVWSQIMVSFLVLCVDDIMMS